MKTQADPAVEASVAIQAARFLSLDLSYGCHRGRFDFPAEPRPILVYGPNGAGKSTLLEALVRGLYGFNKQLRDERARLEDRSPWNAASYRVAVTLGCDDRAWTIERDLVSMEVVIRDEAEGEVPWAGDGNPGASNAEAREFRDRIGKIFGLREREAYVATACIHQGELVGTELGEHLLRIASGGHANVELARRSIQHAHREITTGPIHPGAAAAKKARRLQESEAHLLELRARLGRAVLAEKRRAPLVQESDAVERRLTEVHAEVEALELARARLVDRRAHHSDRERLEERVRATERLLRELTEARAALGAAEERVEEACKGGRYPPDFPERIVRLEGLWMEADRLELAHEEREEALEQAGASPLPIAVAAVIAVLGIVLLLAGYPELGAVLTALGLVGTTGLGVTYHRGKARAAELRSSLDSIDAQRMEIDSRLDEVLSQVPNRATLTAATLADRREAFERQCRAEAARERAGETLAPVIRRIRDDLTGRSEPVGSGAEELERALRRSLTDLNAELARRRLAMEGVERKAPDLPGGVETDEEGLRQAIEDRRGEGRELAERIRELLRRLAEEGSPPESSLALHDRIAAVEAEVEELRTRALAHERAYALVSDAYEAFRDRDQERLVSSVSGRLEQLSGGRLGPVEAEGPLSEATVRIGARSVVLDSPPLSYGEYHAALLAVRLGAVDFLASAGVAPPLLIDEPFAYLDENHCSEVWGLLTRIAQDRQVIVSTQDRLILDHLAVEPDITLSASALPQES